MMFILMKLAALGITGWLLLQTLTLKYAWTRELADLDWTVLGQPGNLLALGLVAVLLLAKRPEREGGE